MHANCIRTLDSPFLAHQRAISFAENAALVDKDVLLDGTTLGRGNEPIALLVGEPFDRSLHLFPSLFRHVSKDMLVAAKVKKSA